MKAKSNRLSHILHRHFHNGDATAMLRRTLIAVAVGLWLIFMLCVLLAWGLTARAAPPSCSTPAVNFATLMVCKTQTARATNSTTTETRTPQFASTHINLATTPQATPTRMAVQLVYCASKPDVVEIEPSLWRVICNYR